MPFALLIEFLLLSSLEVSFFNQSVFGHNFAPNESASFLTLLNATGLVEENILHNKTLAAEHAENAVNLLTEKWIDEISEKNSRVAADLSNAIIDLRNATTQTEIVPSAITEKVSEINDIASEAISARRGINLPLLFCFKNLIVQDNFPALNNRKGNNLR